MSLLKDLATEPELGMEDEEMPTLCQGVDANDLCEVPAVEEIAEDPIADFEKDRFKGGLSSRGDSSTKQSVLTPPAPIEGKELQSSSSPLSGETRHVPTIAEMKPSSMQTLTHCSVESSKAQDVAGNSVVEAQVKDMDGDSLSVPSTTSDGDAACGGAANKSGGRNGPPLLQAEAPPPPVAEAQPVEARQSVATTQKKVGSTGVARPTQAPPVLQPEVITIDDDEAVCDFEEPPLLLPEVAVTRKRKGIVRKRIFFGDTIDSGILKESILEGSPAKRPYKSGTTSVAQSKSSAQSAFTSRLKDGGVTVLISRSGKSGGALVTPKPKIPSKYGGGLTLGDRKKPEDQSARPRLLNRQPLEKKASHIVLSVETKDNPKTDQKMTVVTRDKPLGRRMGSGRQPSRRSGAARCRTSSVRGQGRFSDTAADKRITTGWRSVPPLPLGDVATQCGYADISGHNREVFAPIPPPPGDLVALSRDPEITERLQKVGGGDELDPEGVFMSTALEGFLEEKATLKLSFPVPDCHMPHEKLADEEPEYPPPAQPTPTIVRPQGEPRFKTLLEKQVWLGVRDQKELKAARPVSSPSNDVSSSEAMPLYSLLLPPRYLTPARSSRDLAVHRGRHLLPLSKVMHKSLDMRRAWDEPAKGADCLQFIYDRHHQVRIRGSGSLSEGPTVRAYGKLLRPEAVEAKLNAWLQNEYRVTTEAVSRQRALLVAASVQAQAPTPASGKVSARQQSPQTPRSSSRPPRPSPLAVRHSSRTPRPRRRLLLEDYDTGRMTPRDSADADQATPVAEEKEGFTSLELKGSSTSKQEGSIADQVEGSTAGRQDSIADRAEGFVAEHATNEVGHTVDMDGTADSVSRDMKDVDDEGEVDAAHENEGDVVSEGEIDANEEDQIRDVSQEGVPDLQEDVNQEDDENIEEELGDTSDESEASDQEEQDHRSSGDKSVPDGREDDVFDHQEDISADREKTGLDVRQEHDVSECQEGDLGPQEDGVSGSHQDNNAASHENCEPERGRNPGQRENELGDQDANSLAGDLSVATADQALLLKQSLNVLAGSREASECGDAMEHDVSCESTRPFREPTLQRSNSREVEVQACLGPDTLEDFSAVADVDPSRGDAIKNSDSEKIVGSNTSPKVDTCETFSPSDQTLEDTATDTSHKQSVKTEPVAHLSFFKSLLEKSIRPSIVPTRTTKRCKVNDGMLAADIGSGGESKTNVEVVERDQPAVKVEDANEIAREETPVTSPLKSTPTVKTIEYIKAEGQSENHTCEMPVKVESVSGEDVPCAKSLEVKEGCFSGEGAEVDEERSSETKIQEEGTTALDSAIPAADEGMDTKDDRKSSPAPPDQTPSAAVTEVAPKSEPLSVSESSKDAAAVRRACVHLPRFHLTAVRPYCMFHEVYDCKEYYPGGSCYMTPTRSRILQLQRNLAIRTGRLPPLPARHQHTARTFGRVRPKMVRPRHVTDSCVALLPVPDGTPLPPTRAPPAPRRLALPENVRISQVCEVVLLTPAGSADGSSCHGVLLHGGGLVRVGPGSVRAGVPWHMQPADNVIVTTADGRRFRNPPDRGCTAPVDVEGPGAEVVHFPLTEANRSLTQGRMALINEPDGGLTLTPTRMRVMCRDRLRRVAVGQKGRREVFGTGTVVVVDNAGQLTVIGALPPDATPEDGAGSDSKKEGASQPVEDASGGGSKHSSTGPSAAAVNDDDDDELQVIGTVQGGAKERQMTTGPKRTADSDVNPAVKKRQRGPAEQRARLTPKNNSEATRRKAVLASSQPRSKDGKFLSAAKRVTKTSDTSNAATKDAKEASAEARAVVVIPANRAAKLITAVPVAAETEPPALLTPSWVMNRLHSVTVEVLQADDEPAVAERSSESTGSKVAATPATSKKNQQPSVAGKHPKPLSATGVLMSVVQKIAKNSTKPAKSHVSAEKGSSVKTSTSSQEASQISVGHQLSKLTHGSITDTSVEGRRTLKLAMKSPTSSAPPNAEPVSKSDGDVSRDRSLLKRSLIAGSVAVPVTPTCGARSPKSRTGQRPGLSSRRKRPGAPQVSDGTTLRVCDPARPKVRRKSWTDLQMSRRSWTNDVDAADGAGKAVVPRRRSWDNPAARQSWMNPRDNRPRVRRKSENPQDGARRRLVAGQEANPISPRPRSGEPQAVRPDSVEPIQPREEPAARLSPTGSRPPPTLLRCDGVPVRRRSGGGGGGGEPVSTTSKPLSVVDLTTPEKAPPPPAEAALTTSARRRLKLPLEVTLLNESDMSDDGLDDLGELEVAVPADATSEDVYCPNIELIEL